MLHRILGLSCCLVLVAAGCGLASSDGDRGSEGSSRDAGSEPTAGDGPVASARAMFDGIGPDDPFCSVAVLRGDDLVFAEAYGSDADGPVTTDTEVDIASVSKQFTGLAVTMLIDEGELEATDLVGDLVPASRPATDDLTVAELLTHTSGLADYGDLLPQEYDEPATQREAIDAIARSQPTGSRGEFEYSNSNYVLLAEVVRAVSGEPLPDLLEEEVFGPLDLDMAVDPRGGWTQVGDGSIWTTPTELVTWSEQFWDQTLDGPALASALFDLEVPTGEDDGGTGERYGAGVMRATTDDGAEAVYHDGSWDGYETDWVTIPDERLAAAVTCDEDTAIESETIALDLLELWRR